MSVYDELWSDLVFLKQRSAEQKQYMLNYTIRRYNIDNNMGRFREVMSSAQFIKDRLEKRIKELENDRRNIR